MLAWETEVREPYEDDLVDQAILTVAKLCEAGWSEFFDRIYALVDNVLNRHKDAVPSPKVQ